VIIDNYSLIKRGTNFLKDNLIEFHDFVTVSPEIWKHLNSWYGSDWKIGRYLRRDKIFGNKNKGWVLELYPELERMMSSSMQSL
jgi:hypothetical protein